MEPITNPPIPFLRPIPGNLSNGKLIRIQGCAAPQAERFDINLVTNAAKDNIGLHLSVRILEGYVARNSFEGGIWGEEHDKGELPIQPHQNFEIVIFADTTEYKIAINGRHYCEFPYRIPTSNISHLNIEGDLSLGLISFEEVPQHIKSQASESASSGQQNFGPPSQGNFGGPPQGNFGPPGGPPQGNFGPPGGPPQGNFGPPGGPEYGPAGNFGPPPQGNFGGPPQGNFGPPPQGNYGPPPQGNYGYGAPPPPPPGHDQKGESGLDSFLDSAQTVIQGAIASGMADKLLSSLTAPKQNPQQPSQAYQPQQSNPQTQPNPQQPQAGGPDIIGSLGTLFNTLTTPPNLNQQPQQQQPQQPYWQQQPQQPQQQQQQQQNQNQNQSQPDVIGGLGSLLTTLTSASRNQAQPQQQYQQQQQPQSQQQDALGGLGSLLSSFTQPQQQQQQPMHPSNVGGQGSVGGLGSVGSILTSLAGQVLQPPQQSRQGGH